MSPDSASDVFDTPRNSQPATARRPIMASRLIRGYWHASKARENSRQANIPEANSWRENGIPCFAYYVSLPHDVQHGRFVSTR
jgi:hypothetical protein